MRERECKPMRMHALCRAGVAGVVLAAGCAPRAPQPNRPAAAGWFEDIATRSMFLDNTLRSVTSEDLQHLEEELLKIDSEYQVNSKLVESIAERLRSATKRIVTPPLSQSKHK